ncbi:hypothetical protein D1AOALGA4SA_6382 [Olavius algarvensis Delta 1 endosymbiont]|nr:hypothetical protein D1AOALGA4SA_6382 [Olavius algarvensis Delta 1 endosymbiont]
MTIVPKTKLIVLTAVVCLPVSILVAVMPVAAGPGILLAVALVVVAAADAAVSRERLAKIQISLPEVVRISAGREGQLNLSVQNPDFTVKQLRLGLAFPRQIYSPDQDLVTELPSETSSSLISWPFRALKQGRYLLENCYLETTSKFGFWALRRVEAARAEFRVYPNLLRDRKMISGLFLNRGIGIHTQRQVGKGKEFEQLREYLPGDSYEDIHWKATARRGQPITKVYQIERTQQIYVIIDGSRLSARNSDPPNHHPSHSGGADDLEYTTIMERFAAAALIMGLAADRQGDVFGLLAFDDRVRRFVRAKSGRAHYDVCRDALYTLQARVVAPDFEELFTFIAAKIRRRALLIFLTNLDDPILAESFTSNIDIISRKHLILVNTLRPGGAEPLFSNPSVNSTDDIYQKLGGHLLWRHLRQTEKHLRRHGIGFYLLQNESLCSDLVSQYMNVKRRQVL